MAPAVVVGYIKQQNAAIGSDLAHNSVSLDRLHMTGKHNHVADSLSCDTDLHPIALCNTLLQHPTCKHSMLAGKKVMLFEQNGEELSSFMLSLVHPLQPKKPTPINPLRSGLSIGRDGFNTYNNVDS
ncbi:predicted protein [Chaetoceros tenuissimus]|uniref:Uncharacterized protein n=1 Tax=Chaetoceros tenuissimus TaxID=426638 RepID=A0AAD3CTH0_9STRA|nr:predicted protein [Chaetoceros tenuissimus]